MIDVPLAEFIVEGLRTDGAHHKQWYLEQILEHLIDSRSVRDLFDVDWDPGIAP
jgi:hypothetical protein